MSFKHPLGRGETDKSDGAQQQKSGGKKCDAIYFNLRVKMSRLKVRNECGRNAPQAQGK